MHFTKISIHGNKTQFKCCYKHKKRELSAWLNYFLPFIYKKYNSISTEPYFYICKRIPNSKNSSVMWEYAELDIKEKCIWYSRVLICTSVQYIKYTKEFLLSKAVYCWGKCNYFHLLWFSVLTKMGIWLYHFRDVINKRSLTTTYYRQIIF